MDITTASEEVTVSRKKLYCFARMYQSLEVTGNNPFMGCQFCKISKYGSECAFTYKTIKTYIRSLTGVGLHIMKDINENLGKEHELQCGNISAR